MTTMMLLMIMMILQLLSHFSCLHRNSTPSDRDRNSFPGETNGTQTGCEPASVLQAAASPEAVQQPVTSDASEPPTAVLPLLVRSSHPPTTTTRRSPGLSLLYIYSLSVLSPLLRRGTNPFATVKLKPTTTDDRSAPRVYR